MILKKHLNTVEKFGNNNQGFSPESLSETLEYVYSDWYMGRFAKLLGRDSIAEIYYEKSKSYRKYGMKM